MLKWHYKEQKNALDYSRLFLKGTRAFVVDYHSHLTKFVF